MLGETIQKIKESKKKDKISFFYVSGGIYKGLKEIENLINKSRTELLEKVSKNHYQTTFPDIFKEIKLLIKRKIRSSLLIPPIPQRHR